MDKGKVGMSLVVYDRNWRYWCEHTVFNRLKIREYSCVYICMCV